MTAGGQRGCPRREEVKHLLRGKENIASVCSKGDSYDLIRLTTYKLILPSSCAIVFL